MFTGAPDAWSAGCCAITGAVRAITRIHLCMASPWSTASPSVDHWRQTARAAAAARGQLAVVGHTLFRTHVLVLELLAILRIYRLRSALHGFERNAPELCRLFDERILSGPVMRDHALPNPFIRDGAGHGRPIDRN